MNNKQYEKLIASYTSRFKGLIAQIDDETRNMESTLLKTELISISSDIQFILDELHNQDELGTVVLILGLVEIYIRFRNLSIK